MKQGSIAVLVVIVIVVIATAFFAGYMFYPYHLRSTFSNQTSETSAMATANNDLALQVVGAKEVSSSTANPYLEDHTNQDVLIIDLLFIGGSSCASGCYVSNLINDYQLTADGTIQAMGEYSTKFESAPFLSGTPLGNQAIMPGQKYPEQIYFFVNPGVNNFVLTYNKKSYPVNLSQ